MLNTFLFTIVFFALDHFLLVLILNVISLIVMKYAYTIWHDKLRSPDVRHISRIIFIVIAFMLIVFIVSITYVVSLFIINFHEIEKYTGTWSPMLNYGGRNLYPCL
jgi:hypothetical protein